MTQDLIDNSAFEELAESVGKEFARELLETFLGDAGSMFESLNETLSQEDEDGYRRAAHSIKSNAQTFGATALAVQARNIELSGTFDTAAVAKLQATLDATALALEGLLHD